MLNFGASKPSVKGARAPGPPWICTWDYLLPARHWGKVVSLGRMAFFWYIISSVQGIFLRENVNSYLVLLLLSEARNIVH